MRLVRRRAIIEIHSECGVWRSVEHRHDDGRLNRELSAVRLGTRWNLAFPPPARWSGMLDNEFPSGAQNRNVAGGGAPPAQVGRAQDRRPGTRGMGGGTRSAVSTSRRAHSATGPFVICRIAVSASRGGRLLGAAPMLAASSRADSSAHITSSTFPGSIMASQVNGGLMDIHTEPRTTVTTTVAPTPCMPLTQTLRGIPQPVYATCPLATPSGRVCGFAEGLTT